MSDHQANLFDFNALAAGVHSCFHVDGVSAGLSTDAVPEDLTHLYSRHQQAAAAAGVRALTLPSVMGPFHSWGEGTDLRLPPLDMYEAVQAALGLT